MATPKFDWPFATSTTTSEFGWRILPNGDRNHHNGLDFAPGAGKPIYAIADGEVVEAGWHFELGYYVRIRHQEKPRRLSTGYAHMESAPKVRVGQKVKRGQLLGLVGDTGLAWGDHLHLETWEGPLNRATAVRINPREFMRKYGSGKVVKKRVVGSTAGTPTPSKAKKIYLPNVTYWYRSAADAAKMRNVHGKRRGEIMLSGPYPILQIAANGAIQVRSNSMGKVWLHPSLKKRIVK